MNGQAPPFVLKIALLDDHDVVRHGTFVHLSSDSRFQVVGSHAHSTALITTLSGQHVDVAVIDYTLASNDLHGMELLQLLHRRFPHVRLLVFSAHVNRIMSSAVTAAGAHGLVAKSERLDELALAVGRVAEGHTHLPLKHHQDADERRLSPNEREVLQLCLSGLSVSEIAQRRHRSIKTISTQKHAAFRKLGLRTDRDLYTFRHQLAAI